MIANTDVVVVGGGIAGLAAARAIRAEGLNPVVLEARNQVGGKTESTETEYDDYVEYGGQWVGADQNRVRALLDKFDLKTRPQYYDGNIVRRTNGERYVGETYDETLRALPDEAETELFTAFEEIDQCTAQVPRERPQKAPKAAEWDRMTLASWADDWFDTADAQAAFEVMIPGIYTTEPMDLSFLFFLYYAKTAGGFSMLNGRSSEGDSHGEIVVNVQGSRRHSQRTSTVASGTGSRSIVSKRTTPVSLCRHRIRCTRGGTPWWRFRRRWPAASTTTPDCRWPATN